MPRFIMIKKIIKEHPIKIILASLCILLLMGIKLWNSYAPLSTHDRNQKELSRINVDDPNDFTFAVFGDRRENRPVFALLLRDIDHDTQIAFVVGAGTSLARGKDVAFGVFSSR